MEDKPGKDDNADDEDDQGTEAVNVSTEELFTSSTKTWVGEVPMLG